MTTKDDYGVEWPEIFTDPDFEFDMSNDARFHLAFAFAFHAYGNIGLGYSLMHSEEEMINFGSGMQKIGDVLGFDPTPQNIHRINDQWREAGSDKPYYQVFPYFRPRMLK